MFVRTNNNNKHSYIVYGNLASVGIDTEILVTIRNLIFLAYTSKSTALNFEGLTPFQRSNTSSYSPWNKKSNKINVVREDLK